MEDWQQRVIDERDELKQRMDKLDAFLGDPGSAAKLSHRQSFLMHRQFYAMQEYHTVLCQRIEDFKQS